MKTISLNADAIALKLEPGEYLFVVNRNIFTREHIEDLAQSGPEGVTGRIIAVDGDPHAAIVAIPMGES